MNHAIMNKNVLLTKSSLGLRSQAGLSIIELLIALGIGVFLLAGIIQVTIGSRQSFDVVQAQSSMQEAGRFGVTFIASGVRQAGYVNAGAIDFADPDEFASTLVNVNADLESMTLRWPAQNGFEAGAIVNGTDNATTTGLADAKANTDSLTIRLQGDPDGVMRDCQGAAMSVSDADVIRMTYYVDTNNNLNCAIDGANPVELVSGVENMQIMYGVAVNPSSSIRAGRYVPARELTATDWPNVVAVRVALMTISDNIALEDTSKNYQMLDQAIAGVSDGYARQVFAQSVTLRNRMAQ